MPIPVTVLTGYLGSGKTTLLNRIITERPEQRIVVIENEAGETGIDQDLVVRSAERVIPTGGGCACCAVRDDLINALNGVLLAGLPLDRIVIETSGLADPAPIAQTLLDTARFRDRLRLDSIITLVDAKHVELHLDESAEARKQIALADRLVINKADLVGAASLEALEQRLGRLNAGALRLRARYANVPLDKLLDVAGFSPERAFNLDVETAPSQRSFGWSGAFELAAGPIEISVAECPAMAATFVCLPAGAASSEALRALEAQAEAQFAGDLALIQPDERFVAGEPGRQLMAVEQNVTFWWDVEGPGAYAVFLENPPTPAELELRSGGETLRPIAERRSTLAHAHQYDVIAVSLEEEAPLDGGAVARWLTTLLRVQGQDLFRTKGILCVRGMQERFVIHAVHMMLDGGPDRPWTPDEARTSRLVFIGRDLDRELLLAGLRSCVAGPGKNL